MIYSMTGYGKGESVNNGRNFIVELRSVNNKYREFLIRMPRILNPLEPKLQKLLAMHILRGKVEVNISYLSNFTKGTKISFNEQLANNYHSLLVDICKKFNLAPDDGQILTLIAGFSDIIEVDKSQTEDDNKDYEEEVWNELMAAVEIAITKLLQMRGFEGQALATDIKQRAQRMKELLGDIKGIAPNVAKNHMDRLKIRMEEALSGFIVDEYRFLNEVAHFADKSNIDEEITRLASHLNQLFDILGQGGQIGRKLDFLAQEMGREINTIGSKANFTDISKIVIELKGELEKIREQVQNIE